MELDDLNDRVATFLRGKTMSDKGIEVGVPGLIAFQTPAPTPVEATIYVPIACVTLQGVKETRLRSNAWMFRPGETTIVSHDVPVTTRVTEASLAKPYRSLVLILDLGVLRSLYDQIGEVEFNEPTGTAIDIADADAAFIDAVGRYMAVAEDPIEARVIGPLIYRELHFRLLTAPHGGMLRRLLHLDSHASRVARAISHIRQNYHTSIAIPDLARIAGMSGSSFHTHFRAVTETTPLQYQKDLRLLEAKRLMAEEGIPVSRAAFDVGYESPTQFSRDYSRKFGTSPRADVRVAISS